MLLSSAASVALVLMFSASSVLAAPNCTSLNFTIPATALNLQFPSNYSNLSLATLNDIPRVSVSGIFNITARYCEPENLDVSRRNTIQLLVHGLTYTKDYWSGLGPPGQGYHGDQYSYVAYTSKQGYPTLAIDRVCNGDSSKPNGLLVCQLPINAEILYQIVLQLRSTSIAGQRQFNNVIVVTHSEGSTIAQFLMQLHPDAPVATYVLTAFSNRFLEAGPGVIAQARALPALLVKPSKYPYLDITYFLITNARGIRACFWYGAYDKKCAAYDFATTHPFPAGEIGTSSLSQIPALGYTGSVLVLNGANDQVFCAVSPTDPLVGYRGDCGSGESSITSQTRSLFPNARYYWQQTNNTGHNLNLHLTAPQTFDAINSYLSSQGF